MHLCRLFYELQLKQNRAVIYLNVQKHAEKKELLKS